VLALPFLEVWLVQLELVEVLQVGQQEVQLQVVVPQVEDLKQ
jgi:hypothetical protein